MREQVSFLSAILKLTDLLIGRPYSQIVPEIPAASVEGTGSSPGAEDSGVVDPPVRKSTKKPKVQFSIELLHCDIIGDEFWEQRPFLLAE